MVEMGYYSDRLDSLESRKNEVLGKLATNKLTLKGINVEIEKCKEAINNLTKPIDTDKGVEEIKILKLSNQLDSANKTIAQNKKQITQLKHDLKSKNDEIKYLQTKLDDLKKKKICDEFYSTPRDDVILADDFNKNNVFEEMIGND